jgi:hypothetical protein
MPIQLGSSVINNIFTSQIVRDNFGFIITGSVLGLQSGSYSNAANWTSSFSNGVTASILNSPLASGSNGRWQFNGTDEAIQLLPNITENIPVVIQPNGNGTQVFTTLFYGTIGSLSTRRALFGTDGGYNGGGDSILRTDSSPGAGRIHLDNRAPAGTTNRFTITGDSGSLLNLAIVARSNGSQSVYQDGVLVASSASLTLGWKPLSGSAYIGFNSDTDTDNYNGQLGGVYIYNRELSVAEISQSAQAFYKGNTFGTTEAVSVNTIFVGNQRVFPVDAPIAVASGSTIAIEKSGWTNTGSVWNNASGGISVVGAPLVGAAPNGFWQFDGTNDYITASRALISGSGTLPFQQNGAQNQDWTVLFYGTIGSLTTRRAFMGNPRYNQQGGSPFSGSDILFRRDDPAGLPADKFSVNVRTGRSLGAQGSQVYTLTGSYTSGAIQNMALVWDNPTLSLYQNGVLVSSFASSSWNGPSIFYNAAAGFDTRIFSNANTDASPFNGTLGAFYAYNRALTPAEISGSAQYFAQNL